jgi:prepilin-type N-terminal cleavage/methylation domain-containing protein
MKIRSAFTMIELIFAIVVMGILAKFGVEFLARAYESFIYSSTNNALQAKSAAAVEFVANRLQYRIKDSVIVRTNTGATLTALANAAPNSEYLVLEWISMDIDGFRGTSTPLWSGIIDLDVGADTGGSAYLHSPSTNTVAASALIQNLAHNSGTTIDDAALYFIGSNSDINGFGWDGAITNQNEVMHPINHDSSNPTRFTPRVGTFAGVDIYEYYQLAWTANAIVIQRDTAENKNRLMFHYDYQPWNGERFNTHGKSSILMEDVDTFQAMAIGSIIKIQVCAKSDLVEEYSLCKEKTVY